MDAFQLNVNVTSCGTLYLSIYSNPHFYAGNWSRGGDYVGNFTVTGPY